MGQRQTGSPMLVQRYALLLHLLRAGPLSSFRRELTGLPLRLPGAAAGSFSRATAEALRLFGTSRIATRSLCPPRFAAIQFPPSRSKVAPGVWIAYTSVMTSHMCG